MTAVPAINTQFSKSTLALVAESFDSVTFKRGLGYAREGRVNIVKGESWPVVAKVHGTQSYVVTVSYNPRDEYLQGDCSCPVGVDCKHAAATALIVFQQEEDGGRSREDASHAQRVAEWLADLGREPDVYHSASQSKFVAYVLDRGASGISLTCLETSRLKRGGNARPTTLSSVTDARRGLPSWVAPEDLRRMALINAMSREVSYDARYKIGRLDAALFEELATADLLFWESVQSLPLCWGPGRNETLVWQTCEDKADRFRLGIGKGVVALPAKDTLYVDFTTRTMGTLDIGVAPTLVAQLVSGPSVPESMLPTADRSLRSLQPKEEVPPREERAFVPGLRVSIEMSERFGPSLDIAAEARYGESSFTLARWSGLGEGASHSVIRNMAAEGRAAGWLETLLRDHEIDVAFAQGKQEVLRTAQCLAKEVLPALVSEGWNCDLSEDFPAEMPLMSDEWVEELQPLSDAHNWFSLGLGVSIAGAVVPLLPVLLQAINSGEIKLDLSRLSDNKPAGINLTMADGTLVHVPGHRLQRWLRPLVELRLRGLDKDKTLVLPSFTAADLFPDLPQRYGGASALAEVRERLAALVDLKPRQEGKAFAGELRSYQRQGLAWLRFLHDGGFGGLLCDDMGLGKTVQLLAFIDGLRAARRLNTSSPVLVAAPRSVVGNWQLEAEKFTPKLRSIVHLGPGRAQTPGDLAQSHIVVTSYQTLLRDIELFLELPWASIIFDEAQIIKNHKTKMWRAMRMLKAESRFCVTGTPIENHLGELWAQVDMVMPGLLGTAATFQTVFRKPIEKYADSGALELLRQRIRPFFLRRSKGDVAIDLPEKTEILERISFDTAQRDLYESLRLILDKQVREALLAKGVEGSSLIVLDALLRLRQCCCDPRLVNIPEARKAKKSAKLDRLMNMLCELESEGRFTLVFSQFTSMLELIEQECKKLEIGYLKLTGQTRDRESVIRQFQEGRAPVFLISLKAGGVGLNLTQADTVIHYDPWWNPAAEAQATDRAHRIGQSKKVMVYKLVAQNTLEERICTMQREKQQLTDSTLREGGLSHFGADDLRALFQSL